jgi:excisionase family DNA binding protein
LGYHFARSVKIGSAVADVVLIPLGGGVVLELPREIYEAHLRPVSTPQPPATESPSAPELVTAKVLAARLSLPISCLYQYAKEGRIPCIRAGKHVRFNPAAVLQALRITSNGTGSHG